MQLGKILYYVLIICELFSNQETVHGFFFTPNRLLYGFFVLHSYIYLCD